MDPIILAFIALGLFAASTSIENEAKAPPPAIHVPEDVDFEAETDPVVEALSAGVAEGIGKVLGEVVYRSLLAGH